VEEVTGLISDAGGECLAVRCDVADSTDEQALIDATMKRFESLHVIANNAGVGYAADRSYLCRSC